MRVIVILFCLGCSLFGQELKPIDIDFCDALQHPEQYSGQMVRFRAELHFGRHFYIREGQCGPIALSYPSDSDVKPKPPFDLIRNDVFYKTREFALQNISPPDSKDKRVVSVTMEGRFDSVFSLNKNSKVVRKGKGFGPLGLYDNRLVLRSFEDACVISPGKDNDCVPLEE